MTEPENNYQLSTINYPLPKFGYKKMEVGEIPEDWGVSPIQDLIDQQMIIGHLDGNHGELYPRSHEFKTSGVPYITANDLTGAGVSFQSCKYLAEDRASQFRKGIAKPGDVLFAHNATVGPTGILDEAYPFVILSTTATYFRCNPTLLSNSFLLHSLQSPLFKKQYQSIMAQSTRNQIPITAQRKLSIPLPPTKAEQEAIAEALSDADALIESLEQLIAKKRLLKQGAMQDLLTGQKRLPGFEGEWEMKRLGELLTIRHGRSQRDVESNNGQYPILGSGGEIGRSTAFLCNDPSVLIGRKGTIDRPQYMDKPFWTVDTLFYSEVHSPNNAKFLFYRFWLINWRQFNEASGVPSLNAATIESIEISCPKSAEQTAIAETLSDMDEEIAALEAKLSKARKVKQGMMQELLTGKTRLV